MNLRKHGTITSGIAHSVSEDGQVSHYPLDHGLKKVPYHFVRQHGNLAIIRSVRSGVLWAVPIGKVPKRVRKARGAAIVNMKGRVRE